MKYLISVIALSISPLVYAHMGKHDTPDLLAGLWHQLTGVHLLGLLVVAAGLWLIQCGMSRMRHLLGNKNLR